jgi:hypothetical protein
MEWTSLKTTFPPHSGWYEIRIRIQLDMFEDEETAKRKSIAVAWYDNETKTFKESNAKKSKQILHVNAWRKKEKTTQQEL